MSQNPFARFARWLGLDRNPLRRRSDRAEALVRLAAMVGVVIAVVPGIVLGAHEYRAGLRAEAEQAHARHLVNATLIEDVSGPRLSATGAGTGYARAKWKTADGTEWVSSVEVAPTTSAGGVVHIWVDDKGALTHRPQDRETTIVAALTVGTGFPLAATMLLALVVIATRVVNLRRATREWEAQWTVVEPTWRINGR